MILHFIGFIKLIINVIKLCRLYPNPIKNTLFIDGLNQAGLIEVYNFSGTKMIENFGESINLSSIPSGVYFVVINYDGQHEAIKFLKQ